jgi:hypothetical protein
MKDFKRDQINQSIGAQMEDPEIDPNSKALAARSGNNKVKKRQNKKRLKCTHCKKLGHNDEKCWLKHPELAPEDFWKQIASSAATVWGTLPVVSPCKKNTQKESFVTASDQSQ